MEIVIQGHHAVISDHLRQRAERLVGKLADRASRAVHAVVRFETDGPMRRVEISMHETKRKLVVGEGRAASFGPALSAAAAHVASRLAHEKRTPKARARASRG
ncbi:MAG: HPF/RaiA family ribosome-associated protein [Gemmatimonadaceae bacterium]